MAEFWDGKILLVMPGDPKYATKKVWIRTLGVITLVSKKFNRAVLHTCFYMMVFVFCLCFAG